MCAIHIPDKKFDGTNYRVWSLEMKNVLRSHKLWRYTQCKLWEGELEDCSEEQQALGMVMLSMEVRIQLMYESETGVYELWKKLENAYTNVESYNRGFWLIPAVYGCVKLHENESMDTYIARVQALVDEYPLDQGKLENEARHIKLLRKGVEANDSWKSLADLLDWSIKEDIDNVPKIILQLRQYGRFVKAD